MTNVENFELQNIEALTARAAELHAKGYNCAQSVACTLAPFVGAGFDTCFRATEALGGGMGCFKETCGALSGAMVILGFANSNGSADPTSKPSTYRLARRLEEGFRTGAGATLCCDIKGVADATPSPNCPGAIDLAIKLAATILVELSAAKAESAEGAGAAKGGSAEGAGAASAPQVESAAEQEAETQAEEESKSPYIEFDQFASCDIRVCKVLACDAVPKSKKLLRFDLDDGSGTPRQILSGVHAFYEPEELVGKNVLAILNLPPRKMMGLESFGMILSAVQESADGLERLNLALLDESIPAGDVVC